MQQRGGCVGLILYCAFLAKAEAATYTDLGPLYAPTEYVHVHFCVDLNTYDSLFDNFTVQLQRLDDEMAAHVWHNDASTGSDDKPYFEHTKGHILDQATAIRHDLTERSDALRLRYDHLRSYLAATETTSRVKRGLISGLLSILSFGLGANNAASIHDIEQKLRNNDDRVSEMITTTRRLAEATTEEFTRFRTTIVNLADAIGERDMANYLNYLKTSGQSITTAWSDELDNFEQALFLAQQGIMDPYFAGPQHMEDALTDARELAKSLAMEVIDWHPKSSVMYGDKLTVVYINGGLHLFLHVAVKMLAAPDFRLLRVQQAPVVLPNSSVLLSFHLRDDAMLAVSTDGSLMTEVTLGDLHTCQKRREFYLCSLAVFDREPRSCPAAIWAANAAAMHKYCDRTVLLEDFIIFEVQHDFAVIWAEHNTELRTVCKNRTERQHIKGLQRIEIPKACYLDTTTSRAFRPAAGATRQVELIPDKWNLSLLLGGNDASDLAVVVRAMGKPVDLATALRALDRDKHYDDADSSSIMIVIILGCVATAICFLAAAGLLFYRYRQLYFKAVAVDTEALGSKAGSVLAHVMGGALGNGDDIVKEQVAAQCGKQDCC